MKIYISAGFTERERLRKYRDQLWAMGHEVTSSWLDETAQPPAMDKRTFYRKLGFKDAAEIVASDMLISDHFAPSTSGGRDIEMGIAIGRFQHCAIWIVGVPPKASPFHELADRHFADWEELLAAIGPGPEHAK